MPSTRDGSAVTTTTTSSLFVSLYRGPRRRLQQRGARRAVGLALLELALADQLDEQWSALHHLADAERRLGDPLAARVVALLYGADNAPAPMRSLALDDDLIAEAGPLALALLDMFAAATAPRQRARYVLALNEAFAPVLEERGGANPNVLNDVATAFFRQGGFTDQAISDELNRHAAVTTGGLS